jgi:hypothetical protein
MFKEGLWLGEIPERLREVLSRETPMNKFRTFRVVQTVRTLGRSLKELIFE